MNLKNMLEMAASEVGVIEVSKYGVLARLHNNTSLFLMIDYTRDFGFTHDDTTGTISIVELMKHIPVVTARDIHISNVKGGQITFIVDGRNFVIKLTPINSDSAIMDMDKFRESFTAPMYSIKINDVKVFVRFLEEVWGSDNSDIYLIADGYNMYIVVREGKSDVISYKFNIGTLNKPVQNRVIVPIRVIDLLWNIKYFPLEKDEVYRLHISDFKGGVVIISQGTNYSMSFGPVGNIPNWRNYDGMTVIQFSHIDNPIMMYNSLNNLLDSVPMSLGIANLIGFVLRYTWSNWRKHQHVVNRYYYTTYVMYLDYCLMTKKMVRISNLPLEMKPVENRYYPESLIYTNGQHSVAIMDAIMESDVRRQYQYKDDIKVGIAHSLNVVAKNIFNGYISVALAKHYRNMNTNESEVMIIDAKGLVLLLCSDSKMREILSKT